MIQPKRSVRTDISMFGSMLDHKEKYKKKNTSSVKWSNMNSHHCIFNLKHYLLLRIFIN